jgi:hypothetical protein
LKFKQRTWRAFIVWLALLACAPVARAQQDEWGFWQNGVTESWWLNSKDFSLAEATGGVERWKAIGEEYAAGRAAAGTWAGDYFRGGDTHGTYLRWSPRTGFVIAHVNKCAAQVTGLVYGRVEATPTLVQFFPELDKRPASGHGGHGEHRTPPAPRAVIRYVPVEWRGERLLIAEDEMADFGDYVAGLGNYNGEVLMFLLDYNYFFRGPDTDGVRDNAPPVVPPGYEHFIKQPIEARVTAVGRREFKRDYTIEGAHTSRTFAHASVTRLTINAGTERGVTNGMAFRVTRPDEGDMVFVLRAGRRTSTAIVVRDVDERGAETFYDNGEAGERPHSKASRGWRLTTSPYN